MINDIKKTIHDANKTASINNFEYDEVLVLSIETLINSILKSRST